MTREAEAVSAGADYLSKQHPGWANELDVASLDMRSARYCVLGQLNGRTEHSYFEYLSTRGLDYRWSAEHGFTSAPQDTLEQVVAESDLLRDLWIDTILHHKGLQTDDNTAFLGAQYLNAEHPGWYTKIDLSELDQGSGKHCILGQLARAEGISQVDVGGGFYDFLRHHGLTVAWAEDHGFLRTGLSATRRWRTIVQKLKEHVFATRDC